MLISVTIRVNESSWDIKIDSAQKIGMVLLVLMKCGKFLTDTSYYYLHSHINQRPVSVYKTFADENIYNGDILSAIL